MQKNEIRERLIDVLAESYEFSRNECRKHGLCDGCPAREFGTACNESLRADYLLQNGVTVQAWIPVSERLPQEYGAICINVNLLMDDGFVTVGWLNQVTNKGYYLDMVNDTVISVPLSRFTHWTPLPQAPKED